MAAMDRDVRVGFFVILLGLLTSWLSFTMPSRGEFIESPGIFPGLMSLLMMLFGAILFVRSWAKGGRIRPVRWGRAIVPFLAAPEHRPVILGILLPAVYVFVGIPWIGFYLSSFLFMTIMFYLFVRRWRRWFLFGPMAVALTGVLYLVFNVLFQLQIR